MSDAIVPPLLTVNPPGFPHLLIEDDVHEGYYIPKGTLVMVNIWCADPSLTPPPHI